MDSSSKTLQVHQTSIMRSKNNISLYSSASTEKEHKVTSDRRHNANNNQITSIENNFVKDAVIKPLKTETDVNTSMENKSKPKSEEFCIKGFK
jgi:hypothetical protein